MRSADAIVAKHAPQLRRTFRAHEAGVSSLSQDPSGEIIATASDDGKVGSSHCLWVQCMYREYWSICLRVCVRVEIFKLCLCVCVHAWNV